MKRLAIMLLLCGTAFADPREEFRKAARANDVATVKRMLAAFRRMGRWTSSAGGGGWSRFCKISLFPAVLK